MKNIKKLFALIGITLIIAASGVLGRSSTTPFNSNVAPVEAATATVYTRTLNSDNQIINAPDAYEPGSSYTTIGLSNPQEIFIDHEIIDGKNCDIAYILNASKDKNPFIIKMNLSADNPNETVEKISLTSFAYIDTPTGLWIQEINGVKYLYISDAKATYTINAGVKGKEYIFTGFIYVAPLNNINNYKIITEPVEENNGIITRTPAFGTAELTKFDPQKIAVDSEGKIYIAAPSTSSGMILLSASYLQLEVDTSRLAYSDFVCFFAVNNVQYSALYYLVKTFGTKKQLEQLKEKPEPVGFNNVFIDNQNLVYSMTTKSMPTTTYPSLTKHKTDGSGIFSFNSDWPIEYVDVMVTKDKITFLAEQNGTIVVLDPTGHIIYYFGANLKGTESPDIVGMFKVLKAIGVDSTNRIWAIDQEKEILQSFNPTNYTKAIFEAIISFDNHEYERSRKAWEEVLQYDELSVIANTGLGNAYYYDLQFEEAARYYAIAKNRSMYSEAFWEIRNTWLQNNLTVSILILASFIVVLLILIYLFRSVPALVKVKKKAKEVKKTRFFKDLTVGFRMIRKPTDTFYELKTNRRGSVLGATIYYILALVIFTWYMYGKALPFQIFNENTLSASIVIFGFIGVLAIFVLCNYLVSAIKNGEGTFKNIYKFTGYCLLPIIICLPIAVGLSYVLTLTEKIIMDLLFQLALWGTIFFIVMGILETHNYTFKQTFWNVILTIIFMLLFVIVCLTVLLMFDQVKNLVESIIKEVKLRAGWY